MAKSLKVIDNGYTDTSEDIILELITTIETAMVFIKLLASIMPLLSSAIVSNYIEKLKIMNYVDISVFSKKIRVRIEKK